jgi:hypothetical protein
MTGQLIPPSRRGGIVTTINNTQVSGFALLAAPAMATFEALRALKPAFERIKALDVYRDPKEQDRREDAWELLSWLPGSCALDRAYALFEAAEQDSAPPEWLRAAIDHMLAERPNAKSVGPDYAGGLVDSLMYDDELHGEYEPGISAPVLISVIRELRRSGGDFVPSPDAFLKACVDHRKKFKDHARRTLNLMNVRDRAEAVLYALGETPTDDWTPPKGYEPIWDWDAPLVAAGGRQ